MEQAEISSKQHPKVKAQVLERPATAPCADTRWVSIASPRSCWSPHGAPFGGRASPSAWSAPSVRSLSWLEAKQFLCQPWRGFVRFRVQRI